MRRRNVSRLRWGAEKLQAAPQHEVLEIGFGPGVFIGILIQEHAHKGKILGIDLSDVMYKQASRRNRKAIKAGQVVLQQASVAAIYPVKASASTVSIPAIPVCSGQARWKTCARSPGS